MRLAPKSMSAAERYQIDREVRDPLACSQTVPSWIQGRAGLGCADWSKLAHDLGKRAVARGAVWSTGTVRLWYLPLSMRAMRRREPRWATLSAERQKVRQAPKSTFPEGQRDKSKLDTSQRQSIPGKKSAASSGISR